MRSLRHTGGLVPSNVTLTLTMDLPTLVFGALVLVTVQMSYSGERHLKCFSYSIYAAMGSPMASGFNLRLAGLAAAFRRRWRGRQKIAKNHPPRGHTETQIEFSHGCAGRPAKSR